MSTGIYKTKKNEGITIGMSLYFLFILTRLIPARGSILGLTGLRTKLFLLVCIVLIAYKGKIKIHKIPIFYWIYFGIYVICSIYHFWTKSILNHIYMIMCIIGTVYFILEVIDTEQKFQIALDMILLIFSVYALLGIIEAITKINIFDILTGTSVEYFGANELRFGIARNRGAFGVSINNSMILCMILTLTIYKGIREKKRKYIIPYILLLFDIFLTISRTAWIFVIIIHIFIFLSLGTYKKMNVLMQIIIVGIAIMAVLSMFMPTFFGNFLDISIKMVNSILGSLGNSDVQNDIGELGNRKELWVWVFAALKKHYVWGVGFAQQFSYNVDGWTKESIEITWLYLLYRIGAVGLIGYIIFQIGCIKLGVIEWIKNRKKKQETPSFYYCFLILTVGYFISQFAVAADPDLEIYYIIIGLVLAKKKIDSEVNLTYDKKIKRI